LVERWTGTTWEVQESPSPGLGSNLIGVAATSATNAWAVGASQHPLEEGTTLRTLIEHWNGTTWKAQKSSNPGDQPLLSGVAATSPTNAWAVGNYYKRTRRGAMDRPLIERWNGTSWQVDKSPDLPGDGVLSGVAAVSRTKAWAVGSYYNGSAELTLIEHWNGTAWKIQPSPRRGLDKNRVLESVAATSATNAWAVGYQYGGGSNPSNRTLVEHWNGTAWKVQDSPSSGLLSGVTATSASDAWAVGSDNAQETLIERWNGTSWTREQSSSPGGSMGRNFLHGVAATSSTNAWAVGSFGSPARNLALHWSGTAWTP
jgi:hypothetical protein